MLESVLESMSPVLDFTLLLTRYAEMSGQAQNRFAVHAPHAP